MITAYNSIMIHCGGTAVSSVIMLAAFPPCVHLYTIQQENQQEVIFFRCFIHC